MKSRALVAGLAAAWLAWAGAAAAQQVELRASQAPYYAGVPFDLQVNVTGFDEEPQPQVTVATPPGATLVLTGVSPNVSQSIQITGGHVTRSKTVEFNYNYTITFPSTGRYRVGPAHVVQGSTARDSSAAVFDVVTIPTGGDQRIRLLLGDGPVYVGQRIELRLEWWVNSSLMPQLMNPVVSVPLFDRSDEFLFSDESDSSSAQAALVINTASGPLQLPADSSLQSEGGKKYVVTSVTRTMIPLKAGTYTVEPSTVIVDEAMRWRRDLFGQRIPTQARKLRTSDSARSLVVKDLPAQGRPAAFAGAVGEGYAIEVAADRSVVRTGDPIKLTITLRGRGSLAGARLPSLLDAGLSPEHFRVPAGEVAGIVDGNAKRFEQSIRVLDDSVSEIPPIEYSWFNPKLQRYESARSLPIALSVKRAQVVSAGDVIRSDDDTGNQGAGDQEQAAAGAASQSGGESAGASGAGSAAAPAFTLSGADLAIEKDRDTLLADGGPRLSSFAAQATLYLLGLIAVGLALLARKRAAIDPVLLQRRSELKRLAREIGRAETVAALSAALRRMSAVADKSPRSELDALLAQCDDLVYAPGSEGVKVDEDIRRRARALADAMMKSQA